MKGSNDRIKLVFTILSGDDEFDRACEIIPDSLCTNLPLNYVMNVVNGAASKLAEQVASAKVVLPWLLSTMGAPAYIVGFLLPLRQAGTLLPQLVVSGQMRRFSSVFYLPFFRTLHIWPDICSFRICRSRGVAGAKDISDRPGRSGPAYDLRGICQYRHGCRDAFIRFCGNPGAGLRHPDTYFYPDFFWHRRCRCQFLSAGNIRQR